jgi:trimeric autotransporter adhesin
MSDQRITQLTKLAQADVAANDVLPIVDIGSSITKKVEVKELFQAGANLADSASIDLIKLNQASATKLGTAALADDAVTAAKLADDSSIVYDSVAPSTNNFEGRGYLNSTSKYLQVWNGSSFDQVVAPTAGIENLAVTTGKLAANAVTTAKVDAAGLAAAALATDSVITAKIQDLAVTTGKLAALSVTTAKIAADAVTADELAADAVVTASIVDAAVTEAKLATGAVTETKIGTAAVTVTKVADGSLTYAKLNLADSSVPAAKLVANSVTSSQLSVDAVTTAAITDLNVTTGKLADGAVTAGKIGALAVTAGKIDADAVTDVELADNAVDTAAIQALAVTDAKLAAAAVTETKIADAAVTVTKIADTSITAAKLNLADGSVPGAKLTSASVTTTQIATDAINTSQIVDDAVTTAKIADDAITADQLATNSVTADAIAADAVGASELADDAVDTAAIVNVAVTEAKLATGAVTEAKLGTAAVTVTKIADTSITYAKLNLADGSVPGAKLTDATVTSAKLASDAVTTSSITDLNVTTGKLADGAVTAAKITDATITTAKIAAGGLAESAIATDAITTGKILDAAITAAKMADDSVVIVSAGTPIGSGDFEGQGWFDTNTSVRYVWNGAAWIRQAAINTITFSDTTPLNFAVAYPDNHSAVITTTLDTQVASRALLGPLTGADAAPTFRDIEPGDLPDATASTKGIIQPGTGLAVNAGVLNHSNSATAGTFTKVTIDTEGHVTVGALLDAADIPALNASKITAGELPTDRVADNAITSGKLADYSTASIGEGLPAADFIGQLHLNPIDRAFFMWDGNVYVPIGISAGQILLAGTFDASTPAGVGSVQSITPDGAAAGFVVGDPLPVSTLANNKYYFVVSEGGTITSGNAPNVTLAPPDLCLSVFSTTNPQWVEIDVSSGAGAIAATQVSFNPAASIAATNVQTALEEVSTECRNATNITSGTLAVARGGTGLASYTKGDLLGASAATTLNALTVGTNGQVLRANSATATGLEWGADFVGTVTTVTSSTAALTIATATTTPALTIRAATTSVDGIVQLSDSTSTTSSVLAATPTAVKAAYDLAALALPKAGGIITGALEIGTTGSLVFEGATANGFETTLTVADPTADRTITLPNDTGTVALTSQLNDGTY